MAEPTIVQGMSKEDEKRLDDIFAQVYCKAENNNLRFGEFMQFLLDRELITPKFDLRFYYKLYFDHLALEEIVPRLEKGKQAKKQVKDDTIRFSRTKFLRLVDTLGKTIYHSHKKYLDLILKDIFQDHKKRNEIRVMVFDDANKRLFQENTISMLIDFDHDFKAIFTQYQPENYYRNENMLEWQEVRLMNLRFPIYALINFLYDAAIYPTQYSFENIEDLCLRILPAISIKENQFYQSNYLQQAAEAIQYQKFKPRTQDGDPKIGFIEFQIMLARMSLELLMRDGTLDSKKDPAQAIRSFLIHHGLAPNDQPHKPADFGKHLQLIYRFNEKTTSRTHTTKEATQPSQQDDLATLNHLFMTKKPEKLDYKELVQLFQNDFPPFPNLPTQKNRSEEFLNSLKEKEKREEEARRLEEAKKNKNKPAPKQQQKKGENQFKYQWEEDDSKKPQRKCSYQYFLDFIQQARKTNKLRDLQQFATLSHITSAPVLLPECLYPPDPPQPIRQMVESSFIAFADQNFYLASQFLQQGQEMWQEKGELHDNELIFFEYYNGQINEIAGQDEAALNRFLKVKFHADKLQSDHPDKALPYCGFGSVLYHMEEYELSVRAFTKARMIREACIGDDNIENGLIFNNLGCALHQLGHYFSAETCYLFAIAIFELHLGSLHSMTLNVKRNVSKLKQSKQKQI